MEKQLTPKEKFAIVVSEMSPGNRRKATELFDAALAEATQLRKMVELRDELIANLWAKILEPDPS
jgi:hypothetical protein